MAARLVLLIAAADTRQAWRRSLALGPARLAGTVAAGVALIGGEIWIAHYLAGRLLALPFTELVQAVLTRGSLVITQLATIVATASAITLALPVLESIETDPWWAATPLPRPLRALQAWWRVAGGLAWVLVLAAPLVVTLELHVVPGAASAALQVTRLALLVAIAAAAGTAVALVLASLIPRQVLLPLSWTTTTAAVVGAVLWLRRLHPEQLATATDPNQILTALASLGAHATSPGPLSWLFAGQGAGAALARPLAFAVLGVLVLVLLWGALSPLAAVRLSTGAGGHLRPGRLWRVLDPLLPAGPLGALLGSRLRLLFRDLSQASQTLYLLGLGAVYVENLRCLPLADPLARDLAGLINLAMAGLLTAALALRFAYPAHLLEGEAHWWWSSGPVGWWQAHLAVASVAVLPPLLLSGSLFTASLIVTGAGAATTVGLWLVPWQALWLTVLGVALGPRPAQSRHGSWLDAALGGGGLLFLAVAVAGVGWTVLASGRKVISEILYELAVPWEPGLLLGEPALAAGVLTAATALVVWWRFRRDTAR